MDKQLLQPLKGFRDFLPAEAKKRQYLKNKLIEIFELFGFEPLETPTLEHEEVLTNKSGGEADSMLFRFTDMGERKVAMRYDQTVPTARVLSMYSQTLPMPFRRYQIQNAYRAEKPQSGRFREFLQCDADIYGTSSPIADAEIISLVFTIYKSLGVNSFSIYINDRNLLFDLIDKSGIPIDKQLSVITEIDKLDRKSKSDVASEISKLGIEQKNIDHLFEHLESTKPTEFLNEIIKRSIELGVAADFLKFESRLARGLDYYTSTIFEVKVDGYKQGSLLGGGRYDHLIESLSGIDIPAVGFGLGFDRTLEALDSLHLLPDFSNQNDVLVATFNKELIDESELVVSNLRQNGVIAEIYPDHLVKLDKQIKYADKKGIKWLIIIGPEEKDKNCVLLKNLRTGKQEDVKLEDLVEKIML